MSGAVPGRGRGLCHDYRRVSDSVFGLPVICRNYGSAHAAISLLVGASQTALLGRLRASSRAIQRAASLLLVLVGIGLIYFTLDAGTFQSIFIPS